MTATRMRTIFVQSIDQKYEKLNTLLRKLQALKNKFKDKMSEFQDIHQEYREVVERRVFTGFNWALCWFLLVHNVFAFFFKNKAEDKYIMDTLAETQERHDAVRDLEKKLLELHQIFMDISVLVDYQGDMLNNIESQVTSAVDHVDRGTKALKRAKSSQNTRENGCALQSS
ncbi:hypothetical protein CASFOL_041680 [Castilleja foliolosa]|uniref:t-SNARE coiled-coil homology domain-containing protein n=1 Tax=Castilleja foliolosa TaxID=1961234 RepID=A0ABD3BBG6_9LAMI